MNKAERLAMIEKLAVEIAEMDADTAARRVWRELNEDYVMPVANDIVTKGYVEQAPPEMLERSRANHLNRAQAAAIDSDTFAAQMQPYLDFIADEVGAHGAEILQPILLRLIELETEVTRLKNSNVTSINTGKRHAAA